MPKAVFFDRDNTLTRDTGYTHRVEDLELLPGAAEAVRMLKNAGFLIFLITNQSGIGLGMYTLENAESFNRALEKALGIPFDGVGICPHIPGSGCVCRKPETGMVTPFLLDFALDPAYCTFVGDRETDVECGRRCGMRTILLAEPGTETNADATFSSLLSVSQWILEQNASSS